MLSHCLVCPLFTPKVRILRRGRVYVLGRDAKADFSLPSDIISRRHAEVQWSPDGGFLVRDLKSKNGTRVNDVPVIGERALADGDRISVGPFTLQYREYRGDIAQLLEGDEDAAEATAALSRDLLASHMAGLSAGFGGNFGGQELLEICRLIAMSEKDGVLTVRGAEVSGQVGFERGEIVSATTPASRGEEAAYALLALTAGQFEFAQGPAGPRNCQIRTEQIAMEAARRQDEGATRPPVPDANSSSTVIADRPPSAP